MTRSADEAASCPVYLLVWKLRDLDGCSQVAKSKDDEAPNEAVATRSKFQVSKHCVCQVFLFKSFLLGGSGRSVSPRGL